MAVKFVLHDAVLSSTPQKRGKIKIMIFAYECKRKWPDFSSCKKVFDFVFPNSWTKINGACFSS